MVPAFRQAFPFKAQLQALWFFCESWILSSMKNGCKESLHREHFTGSQTVWDLVPHWLVTWPCELKQVASPLELQNPHSYVGDKK